VMHGMQLVRGEWGGAGPGRRCGGGRNQNVTPRSGQKLDKTSAKQIQADESVEIGESDSVRTLESPRPGRILAATALHAGGGSFYL
jgi:hypothetical protein